MKTDSTFRNYRYFDIQKMFGLILNPKMSSKFKPKVTNKQVSSLLPRGDIFDTSWLILSQFQTK